MDAHRRGVCDKDGYSVKNEQGVMAAKPHSPGYVTWRRTYPDAFKGKGE